MNVRKCEKCESYERRRWSSYYQPNGYHAIGMTHAYGYCRKYKARCLNVQKCTEKRNDG